MHNTSDKYVIILRLQTGTVVSEALVGAVVQAAVVLVQAGVEEATLAADSAAEEATLAVGLVAEEAT